MRQSMGSLVFRRVLRTETRSFVRAIWLAARSSVNSAAVMLNVSRISFQTVIAWWKAKRIVLAIRSSFVVTEKRNWMPIAILGAPIMHAFQRTINRKKRNLALGRFPTRRKYKKSRAHARLFLWQWNIGCGIKRE